MCRLCGTSESLKLLDLCGPVQARTRIALPVVVAVAVAAAVVVMALVVVVVAVAVAALGAVVVIMFTTVTTECTRIKKMIRSSRITDVMPNHEQNFNLLWIVNLTQDLWL
jgi:hypothetical protein